MATSYDHAKSAASKFGGDWNNYIELENWMDGSKEHFGDYRHRALRHHSEGIFLGEKLFGTVIINSDGNSIPVRSILELHVIEDCGFIPSIKDWFSQIKPAPWMRGVGVTKEYFGQL